LLNGLALLGWNPPHREDPNVLAEGASGFLKHEVLDMSEMEQIFNISKVGKSGVKFEEKKLEFLNAMHIRNLFTYYEEASEKKGCLDMWRDVLLETLPSNLHSKIRATSDLKMTRVMDMMKTRIHFYSDLLNHTYFWEQPSYDTARGKKFLRKLHQPDSVKIEILKDLIHLLKVSAGGNVINAEQVNKICSMYLHENQDRGFKNEDVFFLLRYAVTGNPVGAPTGDICEVIGL